MLTMYYCTQPLTVEDWNTNCAISFGYQQKKFLRETKLEFHNKM